MPPAAPPLKGAGMKAVLWLTVLRSTVSVAVLVIPAPPGAEFPVTTLSRTVKTPR